MPASNKGREDVVSYRNHLNTEGSEFLAAHPFEGMRHSFPKTVETVKALAQQVSDGLITSDEADTKAREALDAECDEHVTSGKFDTQAALDDLFEVMSAGQVH